MICLKNVNSGLKQVDENQSLIDKYNLSRVMDNLYTVEDCMELISCEDLTDEQLNNLQYGLELLGYAIDRLEEE